MQQHVEHHSRSKLIREVLRSYLQTCHIRILHLIQAAKDRVLYREFTAQFKALEFASDEALKNFEDGLAEL